MQLRPLLCAALILPLALQAAHLNARRASPYWGAIAADADTGRILFADRADRQAYPASVTKLMTMLLVLEDIRDGFYTLETQMTGTVRASREEPSIIGLKPGATMSVDDLLTAIMLKSANDAAVVLAENASAIRAGRKEITPDDLPAFIKRMNEKAQRLGMCDTRYESPNGLPPPKGSKRGFDVSTAADLVKLARACLARPETLRYTSKKIAKVKVGGEEVGMVNHNNIMVKNKWKILNSKGESEVDGLKTGYIDAGGSSIVLTGSRAGHRAIVVVLGSDRAPMRDTEARRLMLDALSALDN